MAERPTAAEAEWSSRVDLTFDELSLVRTALRLLLAAEDDTDEQRSIKRLLERLPDTPEH